MSYSSLIGINKDYTGKVIEKFQNSRLFSPIIWDVLAEKYIPREKLMIGGCARSMIRDTSLFNEVNSIINACENTADRICWEFSNQQIFFTKDKQYVINGIRDFVKQNQYYCSDWNDDNIPILKRDHIIERFNEIADAVDTLDDDTPYFVMKNTSIDDTVENWFGKYDRETGMYVKIPMSQLERFVTEFVIIKDGKISGFISNLKFDYKGRET